MTTIKQVNIPQQQRALMVEVQAHQVVVHNMLDVTAVVGISIVKI